MNSRVLTDKFKDLFFELMERQKDASLKQNLKKKIKPFFKDASIVPMNIFV